MSKLRGDRKAKKLQAAILDLIGDFDEELTEARLSRRTVDAHVAAILINLLRLIVTERETYSGADLSEVFKKTLQEAMHEH